MPIYLVISPYCTDDNAYEDIEAFMMPLTDAARADLRRALDVIHLAQERFPDTTFSFRVHNPHGVLLKNINAGLYERLFDNKPLYMSEEPVGDAVRLISSVLIICSDETVHFRAVTNWDEDEYETDPIPAASLLSDDHEIFQFEEGEE